MSLILLLEMYAAAAAFLAFLLQFLHQRLNISQTLKWIVFHFPLFLAGTLALFSFVMLWAALLDSFVLACCICGAVFLLLGYTDYLMLYYREQPLVPRDLAMALNLNRLLTMISPVSVALILLALAAVTGCAILLCQVIPPLSLGINVRIPHILLGLFIWLSFCRCGKSRSVSRHFFILCGADFDTYQQSGDFIASFDNNGFVAAFFSLCLHPIMETPANYSQDTILKITSTYTGKPASRSGFPHVLFIMSEAFSDPLQLSGLALSGDPIPFIRNLMRHTPSGRILAPGYGGGTAHCEFEALTGFSTTLSGGVSPYENAVNRRPAFPSIAREFKEQGYRTIALHPYKRGMYARTEAYPNLGFDLFTDVTGMRHTGKVDNNPYVSDSEAYDEILDILNASDIPLFLHLVTMQNHGDYIQSGRFQTTIHSTGFTRAKERTSVENYVQGLRYTDNATQDFLNRISQLGKQVLVVFWGDHLPGAYPSAFIRDKHIEKYETPFFFWSSQGLDPVDFGARSPMMLASLLKASAGLALTPYDQFLLELQDTIHGLHPRFLVRADGSAVSISQLSQKERTMLQQLQLLQYDILLGQNWSARNGFYTLPSQ